MSAPATPVACPFCASVDAEQVGLWGGQMITAQWRCRACGAYFEAIREALDSSRSPFAAQAADRPRSAPSSSDAK